LAIHEYTVVQKCAFGQQREGSDSSMKTSYTSLLREIEFLEVSHRSIVAEGPTFRIFHRFQIVGLPCSAGEEVSHVLLSYEGNECVLPLSTAVIQLFDYIAKHRFGVTAQQITTGMKNDPFYRRHGSNGQSGGSTIRRFSRSSIKEYVKRIRAAIQSAASTMGLRVKGESVLVTESTESNEARYRLRAHCEWVHIAPILNTQSP
jgi:hypothetical protein